MEYGWEIQEWEISRWKSKLAWGNQDTGQVQAPPAKVQCCYLESPQRSVAIKSSFPWIRAISRVPGQSWPAVPSLVN